ncbi:hypothetical protein DFH08DRAFT_838150 [Mycena albidolilacea]|uniref:Uncharacterized protein n=1 Tax=Mycena albidolilacea TaxID=1033008 RepID=A0AAD7AP36_9AGAR|nr:hypothetical protein DFH08DRAFT_838150 [Mycena albidolilacea]
MKSFAWVAVLFLSIFVFSRRRPGSYLFKRDSPAFFYLHGDAESQCERKSAPDLKFCEDAAFWEIHEEATGSTRSDIIISCDPGRGEWNTVMGPLRDPGPHGVLWLLSAEKDAVPQRILKENYPPNHDFHPLGIAIWPSRGNSPSNLFVVNHARKRSVIEQFIISPKNPGVATHVRTISSAYLVSPNSIALTSPSSFYVSNDHLMTRRLPGGLGNVLPLLETFLTLPLGWVSHISLDPAAHTPILEHKFAAFGIPFANGVSISPSGSEIAIASSTTSEVRIYSRDPITNALTRTHTVPVPFCPDNLDYDAAGTLIASGHPHFPSLIKVKNDPANTKSPSWVVAINQTHNVETLFQSDGTYFSSSATGLRDATTGALVVSGLYESGVLVCRPAP